MPESRWLSAGREYWALLICVLAILVLGGCARREGEPTPLPTATLSSGVEVPVQMRAFDALYTVVAENYVQADFGGVDWEGLCARYAGDARLARTEEAFAEVVRALLNHLPPDSVVWQSRSERIQRDLEDTSVYQGIGAYISVRATPVPHVVVLSVVPESPAEKAGLQAHDSILAIDGEPVREEEGMEVVRRIRGPAESQVTLTVQSPGRSPRDVVVTRAELVAFDRLRLGVIPNSQIVYFLFPPSPYEDLADEVVGSLQAFAAEFALRGVILDLRIATTGSGWPLLEMLTVFTDGKMGEFYTRKEANPLEVEGQDFGGSQTLPVAILVGPDTRGLPEVFAAAMQAVGRAIVIGLPTPGSVGGLSEFPLPDGSRVFVLTSSFRTPAGQELRNNGIQPDVPVQADWDAVTVANDPVRDAAVKVLSTPQSTQFYRQPLRAGIG